MGEIQYLRYTHHVGGDIDAIANGVDPGLEQAMTQATRFALASALCN
jgi:hypothetical protein